MTHNTSRDEINQNQIDNQINWSGNTSLNFDVIKEEIWKTLVDNMISYIETERIDLEEVSSFDDLFEEFLQSDKGRDFEKQLRSYFSKISIKWDDIKDLTLNFSSTIEDLLVKEIFKKFRRKNVVKGVIYTFLEKIENIVGKNNEFEKIKGNIISKLEKDLKTEEDVINLLNFIKNQFSDLISKLPSELKEKIRWLEVSNEEILNSLIKYNILTDEELTLLKGSNESIIIENLSQVYMEKLKDVVLLDQIKDLENIIENLLLSNIIEKYLDVWKTVEKIVTDFSNIFNLPTLKDVIDFDFKEFEEFFEKNKDNYKSLLLEKDVCKEYINWDLSKKERCIDSLKKDFNITKIVFIDYLKTKDIDLAKIMEKILNWVELSDSEKKILVSKYINENFKNVLIKYISLAYRLTSDELIKFKELIDRIFDINNKELELEIYDGSIIKLPFKKYIRICDNWCNFKNLNDILDFSFDIVFEIEKFENTVFESLFKWYLNNILGKKISDFQKVNIKLKTWESYENVYLSKLPNWKVLILKKPLEEIIDEKNDIITYVSEDNISEITLLEDIKVRFNSLQNDFKKFILFLPQLISERVNLELKKESLEDFLDKLLPWQGKKKVSLVKEEKEKKVKFDKILEEIKSELKKFYGDVKSIEKIKSIKDLENFVIMVDWTGLSIPWFSREFLKISFRHIDLDSNKVKFVLEWSFYDIPDSIKEPEVSLDSLKDLLLKIKFSKKSYIFRKVNNYSNFEDYYNKILPNLDWKDDENFSYWKRNIKIKDKKFLKKQPDESYKEVKYIVKKYVSGWKEQFQVIKVEFLEDWYKLLFCEEFDKNLECKKFRQLNNKKLSFNHFISWITSESDLKWMTDEEYKLFIDNIYNKKSWLGNLWLNFVSPAVLLFTIKNLWNVIKSHFKETDDIKSAELYLKLANLFPKWSIFEEIKLEARAERDSRIMGYINKFKNRLIRADEGKWGAHWSQAADIIKKEIFEKVIHEDLWRFERYKAAWYLLYAMEKWPWPYFRSLADYNWQGLWVKALLGKDQWKNWKKINAELLIKFRENPEDSTIKDQLVISEIKYIYMHPNLSDIFPVSFWPTLEWLTIDLYSEAKAAGVKESEAKKGNFWDIENAFLSYIWNRRIPNAIGAFWALAERVESEDHYIEFYKDLLLMILSWFVTTEIKWELRERYDKICRTYWYQIWLLAHSGEGYKKILRILDAIVVWKDLKLPDWSSTFSEYIFWKWVKVDEIDLWDLKYRTKSFFSKDLVKKINELWTIHWKNIVSSLDFSDTTLFNVLESIKDEKINNAIEDYISSLQEKIDEWWVIDTNLFTSSLVPYYIDGAFNLNRKVFKWKVLSIDEGDYKDGSTANAIIKAILSKLSILEDLKVQYPVFKFLLAKFDTRFGFIYTYNKRKYLVDSLSKIDTITKNDFINNFWTPIREKYEFDGKYPDSLEYLVKRYAEILYDGLRYWYNKDIYKYKELVSSVFWDDILRK
jgi:hypothetical protein